MRVSEVRREGKRLDRSVKKVPLAYPDYIDYFVNKAPSYERISEKELVCCMIMLCESIKLKLRQVPPPIDSGLTQKGAEAKWRKDFTSPEVERFQARKLGESGEWTGELVSKLHSHHHTRIA